MQRAVLGLTLILMSVPLLGQVEWHKKIPFNILAAPNVGLTATDDTYLVNNQNQFIQFGEDGRVLGEIKNLPILSYWVCPRKVPLTENLHFWIGRRPVSTEKYYLGDYQPGIGLQNEHEFADSLSSFSQRKSPVWVVIDDQTAVAFGNKYIRCIQQLADGSFSAKWTQNATFSATSAVWTGSQLVACGFSGNIKAYDELGNILWEKYYPFETTHIKACPGGFVVAGLDDLNKPVLLFLNPNGDLEWNAPIPGKLMNDLTPTSDGGFVLAGQTDSSTVLLVKTNASGDVLWSKSYGQGKALFVSGRPDGHLAVLYQGTSVFLYLMKCNAAGDAPPLEQKVLIRDRTLNNGGFSLNQNPSSSLFFNNQQPSLSIPAGNMTRTLYAHSPWIIAKDTAGLLYVCASKNGEYIESDYRVGIGQGYEEDFNRLWAVTREEIASFRRDFEADGDLDVPPPFDLLSWPATGNPFFKHNYDFSMVQTHPDSFPAPFVDRNGDGYYNVYDGDYPSIKGDRMLWWAFTDQKIHQLTDGLSLGIDIFLSVYAYDCPQNENMHQSIFTEYQFVNRAKIDYSDTQIGFYTDPDLGCPEDDYNGSIPSAHSTYVYNKDAIDGNPGASCAGGIGTYEEQVPVQSIKWLNHSLDLATYFDQTTSNLGQSEPFDPYQYNYYFQGSWRDGGPLTIGGTGYNPTDPNAIPTRFAFPDPPNDPQGWSMCTSNLPLADRRMLSAHGPFTFAAGDTFTVQLAFIFQDDIPHPCPDIVGLVEPVLLQIQQWHDDGVLEERPDLGAVQTLPTGQTITLDAALTHALAYQWSTGASTPSIVVDQPGEYTVQVTQTNGCVSAERVLVQTASGTYSPTLPIWQVSPNPATVQLNILFEGDQPNFKALLYNAQGQLVMSKTAVENGVELSVSQLSAGLYWVEVWQEGQFWGSRKVIVAK